MGFGIHIRCQITREETPTRAEKRLLYSILKAGAKDGTRSGPRLHGEVYLSSAVFLSTHMSSPRIIVEVVCYTSHFRVLSAPDRHHRLDLLRDWTTILLVLPKDLETTHYGPITAGLS